MTSRALTYTVPPTPDAPSRARHRAVDHVVDLGRDDLAFVVELLVSEAVTNSVRNGARGDIEVTVRPKNGRVRVEVVDDAPGIPALRRPGAGDDGGRGLPLLDSLSEAWGVDRLDGAKRLWFEICEGAQR